MSEDEFDIAGHKIGGGNPPFIIAELSANHNQSLDKALQIVEEAARAGAHAIKIQTYTADTMTLDMKEGDFFISDPNSLWRGKSLYELYSEAYTPWEWHERIFNRAHQLGLIAFSTPFDETAVDLLEELNTPVYKIASFEVGDLPLIRYVAKTGKPMIISTGMANEVEIGEAVNTAREGGCENIILLHCISGYPAPFDQANLMTIPDLAKRFDVLTGLSDHTLGTTVSVASIALGACVIEKHVTLCRSDNGPDSKFSLEPDELKRLCEECKTAWSAMGNPGYELKAVEKSNVKFRRSLYVVKDIKSGEPLTKENISRIRPGYGLAPKYFDEVMGKVAKGDIARGTALKWEDIL